MAAISLCQGREYLAGQVCAFVTGKKNRRKIKKLIYDLMNIYHHGLYLKGDGKLSIIRFF